MGAGTRYTESVLREAVLASTSVAGVLRFLGLRQAGGTQAHVARRIRDFEIDTSHFTAKRTVAESRAAAGESPNRFSSFDLLDRFAKSRRRFAAR